ncbi:TRAP transporter large permease [Falsigemmobacter intermedius]|uniref:TRAP transporter large permease n=1 Tax=Falsigemmobacter intermedius TaxID=1553448 RepID=A0A3S3VLI0_9RHOB|nr:TRAP transporter large permease [Falsigemmobacter intermedius]RWY38442.1 TRAP transporter large permease [Falsigemmobacter intermedius]
MSEVEIGITFVALLFGMILIRVPIGFALIAVSFCGIWALLGWRIAWGAIGVVPYHFASNWVLSSVPAFLFMGFFCYHARLTEGLFHAARVWMSGLPGGLAVASVFGCGGFASVTGSSVACSAAMGKIAVPEMTRYGYDKGLATGSVAAGGTIGALIPPSLIMILFAVIAQAPVGKLFMGGLVVGLITLFIYAALIIIRVKINPSLAPPVSESYSMAEKLRALLSTLPVLAILCGVFGGLFAGVFTPTEAGAIGALLSMAVAALSGRFSIDALRKSAFETVTTTTALMLITIGASLLTRFLALSGSGQALTSAILAFGAEPLMIILGITLIYLLLGMFLEPVGCMMLTLPVVLPLITKSGYEVLWFGVFLTKLLEIGMLTPPIGMNVFVIKGVVEKDISLGQIFRGVTWFIVADLLLVAALIFWPEIVTWLPKTFG